MPVTATGIVRHQFFGEYSAVVVLAFDPDDQLSPGYARQAFAMLNREPIPQGVIKNAIGSPGLSHTSWEVHPEAHHRLRALVSSDGLAHVEATLKALGVLTFADCGWRHCKRRYPATLKLDSGVNSGVEVPHPLAGHQRCDAESISECTHSIDYGPQFQWTVSLSDPRQIDLFPDLSQKGDH